MEEDTARHVRLLLLLQSQVKMFFGKTIWGNACHNGSSANMASTVHAEGLHMVVIVGFAAEAWKRKNKRMQTYKHILYL